MKYVQVITTVNTKSGAERIARVLLEKKLSACTQLCGPMTSVYRWKGRVKKSREWLCVAKTKVNLYAQVEKTIRAIYPYELPEIIAVPIVKGSVGYLRWLEKEI